MGIESKQHMIDKTAIEDKIPTRRKDTKKRIILDRNQVKENKEIRYQNSNNKYQMKQISMEKISNSK